MRGALLLIHVVLGAAAFIARPPIGAGLLRGSGGAESPRLAAGPAQADADADTETDRALADAFAMLEDERAEVAPPSDAARTEVAAAPASATAAEGARPQVAAAPAPATAAEASRPQVPAAPAPATAAEAASPQVTVAPAPAAAAEAARPQVAAAPAPARGKNARPQVALATALATTRAEVAAAPAPATAAKPPVAAAAAAAPATKGKVERPAGRLPATAVKAARLAAKNKKVNSLARAPATPAKVPQLEAQQEALAQVKRFQPPADEAARSEAQDPLLRLQAEALAQVQRSMSESKAKEHMSLLSVGDGEDISQLSLAEEELGAEMERATFEDDMAQAQQKAQNVFEEVAKAAEADGLWSASTGKAGGCTRFVVLTTQRSGSTWLFKNLSGLRPGQVRVTFEAFNTGEGQDGSKFLQRFKKVPWDADGQLRRKTVNEIGARRWAEYVWQGLETSNASWLGPPLKTPCAVGFKMMGPVVDAFSYKNSVDVLLDRSVKKIVLDRGNAHAQWLSRQWACWSSDFGSHKEVSLMSQQEKEVTRSQELVNTLLKDGTWKKWTAELANSNHLCNMGRLTKFEDFKSYKESLFKRWRDVLDDTKQEWLDIKTEGLSDPDLMPLLEEFLLGEDAAAEAL